MRIIFTLPLMIMTLIIALILADSARCSAIEGEFCSNYEEKRWESTKK